MDKPATTPLSLVLPITSVTVFEDRAHVVRRGRVTLPRGSSRHLVEGVAPVLGDKTLAGALDSASQKSSPAALAKVHDLAVRRAERIERASRPEDVRLLDEEIGTVDKAHQACSAKRKRFELELSGLARSHALLLEEIAEDTSFARVEPERWAKELDLIRERSNVARKAMHVIDLEARESSERLTRLRARKAALTSPATDIEAKIELTVLAEEAGEYTLTVSYVVPGACWRPRHTATLSTARETTRDAPREARDVVEMRCDAFVWQNTGEDWTDVALTFSTERTSAAHEPPLLANDILRVTRKSPQTTVEVREDDIEQAGLGAKPVSSELLGIDDGGEPQKLAAPHLASIPSDGRPHAVTLFSFVTEAKVELVLSGELTTSVVQRATQVNEAKVPLLAGPVDLIREGGLVGRTAILFVAPREKFALGFGPDGALRAHRELEHLRTDTSMLGAWNTETREVRLFLSNMGDTKRRIVVTERVPVSEIEKVQITVVTTETTGQTNADAIGFVRWTVDVLPGGHEKLRLRYVVKKHADVVGL